MSGTFERPAAGARPARGVAALLAGAPLVRVRRLFLALALVACTVAVGAVAGMPDRTPGLRLAGLAAIAVLAAIWLRSYRREALSPVDEPVELSALFAVGLAVGPDAALGLIYAGLYRRSLYGSPPRAAAGLAVYALAHVLAVVADGGDLTLVDTAAQLPPLAIGCAVMQAFAVALARHDESLARERVMRDASAALVGARDRRSVHGAMLDAVERLSLDAPVAAVVALHGESGDFAVRAATGQWLPGIASACVSAADLPRDVVDDLAGGRARRIASPRLAGLELFAPPDVAAMTGVCVPLSARGRLRGVVAVFGVGVDAPQHLDVLETLAAEAALALSGIDAADDAAYDRSIERITERVSGMI